MERGQDPTVIANGILFQAARIELLEFEWAASLKSYGRYVIGGRLCRWVFQEPSIASF